jgi:hypothetical protein
VLVHYAVQARGLARSALLGSAVVVAAIFGAWPTWLWGEIHDPLGWNWGLIWSPPNGDHREHLWRGFQLVVGNAYVLTGVVLLIGLMALAAAMQGPREHPPSPAALPESVPGGQAQAPGEAAPAG